MIKVCDAIMGSGKSSAAINYMNEESFRTCGSKKFIYITPFLSEAARIKEACPLLDFQEPSDKISRCHFRKCEHAAELIKEGKNIATTHRSFANYTQAMLTDIKSKDYTLIIDENVYVLDKYVLETEDVKILTQSGYVTDENGNYTLVKQGYKGKAFKDILETLETRGLTLQATKSEKRKDLYYWLLPPELISSFSDVFVLTYMFEGQSLYNFFKIYDFDFVYIGVKKDENGVYRFGKPNEYIPEYVGTIKDKLHIMDNEKLNKIGSGTHALSMSWYQRGGENVERMRKNIFNYMHNIWKGVGFKEKMWSSFSTFEHKLGGRGYTKAFLPFNSRATNEYSGCKYLIYAVNIYMNVGDKCFYQSKGIEVSDDLYALSTMVQWIWRSAIRNGEEVYLYLPSRRMRDLLTGWIESLERGGEDY